MNCISGVELERRPQVRSHPKHGNLASKFLSQALAALGLVNRCFALIIAQKRKTLATSNYGRMPSALNASVVLDRAMFTMLSIAYCAELARAEWQFGLKSNVFPVFKPLQLMTKSASGPPRISA
jgi:hypothetical protein